MMIRTTTVCLAALALGSCDSNDGRFWDRSGSAAHKVASDRDWQQIVSATDMSARKPSETVLAHFMRRMESADRRRRDLGLKFWDAHPHDPRRFKWLILTVHMPPHYAESLDDWARREEQVTANAAALDKAAAAAWDERYKELRQEFWSSPDVTDQERRFLWFGEIEQRILRAAEARARGEASDAGAIVDQISKFSSAYPRAFDFSDEEEFGWIFARLANYVGADHGDVFSTAPGRSALIDKLRGTGNPTLRGAGEQLEAHIKTRANASPRPRNLLLLLPKYPDDHPRSLEGRMAFHHDLMIATMKFREIGLANFRDFLSDEGRRDWFGMTLGSPPVYARDVGEQIREGADSSKAILPDQIFYSNWVRARNNLLKYFARSAGEASISDLLALTIIEDTRYARHAWMTRKDNSLSRDLVRRVAEIGLKYNDPISAESAALRLIRERISLGLGWPDLSAELTGFSRSENSRLRELGERVAVQSRNAIEPFNFRAPTMEGEPFDVASLRGKVVLVDHWATSCSSCIAAMPRLKEVYKKYRSRGFEVVSIAYDGKRNRDSVLDIEQRINAGWISLNGEGQWDVIAKRYLYFGNPQYMLLDREGRIIAGTEEVNLGKGLPKLLEAAL